MFIAATDAHLDLGIRPVNRPRWCGRGAVAWGGWIFLRRSLGVDYGPWVFAAVSPEGVGLVGGGRRVPDMATEFGISDQGVRLDGWGADMGVSTLATGIRPRATAGHDSRHLTHGEYPWDWCRSR